jgi:hypothetical protein
VHFPSLFDFARHIPFDQATPYPPGAKLAVEVQQQPSRNRQMN